ncbi:hypothetical protein Tco_0536681, partial [Tanacetum coccineum]
SLSLSNFNWTATSTVSFTLDARSDSNKETLHSNPNRDAKFWISGTVVVGIVVVVVVESCVFDTCWNRIFTKGQKLNPTRIKPRAKLERARKTEAKGTNELKTELKRIFPDRIDNVCAFNEVKVKPRDTALERAWKNNPETLS